MSDLAPYVSGPPAGAEVIKDGDRWTLILKRELKHAPELVWGALIDPEQLREWAPFEIEGNLEQEGSAVRITWSGTGQIVSAVVTKAVIPSELEFTDIRWELQPMHHGTLLTLWHRIDRRYVAWGAAGWHICFDVLERMLGGDPIGRIAGVNAMKLEGWKRLTTEYAELFGAELPGSTKH